ncbi:mediator of RNA polymerase II transcription subunit 13-like [Saccostrea cucullata]|uniref:mediator of RNA polymerase II transcription subunit 13-like n=1 Tax=Saccostrea cuccullata TaxID=36930 RepID=UPI002ED66FAC
MSHSTPSGNGCSLEDCYTNLFSLTEIRGIKWKRLSANPEYTTVDQLEDPVLVSYAKCIKADILSVWRRVPRSSDQPRYTTDQLAYNKELWIFWYGDEPENLNRLLSEDLKEDASGGWDKGECGISYECRTLIFKALHNLIEKCLLHRGFVRIGKWFVQPHDVTPSGQERSTHLSFCFNFFLHGESSVCASIEVKQHPPVWRLTNHHLALAQENPDSLQVILVPYGLCGKLTGNSYRDTDQSASKIMEEWSQFYPLDKNDGTDVSRVPPLVEVTVAGVRMKYPSCYVLLCEMEDAPARAPNPTVQRPGVAPGGLLTPPTSPAAAGIHPGADAGGKTQCAPYTGAHTDANTDLMAKSSRAFSARITEKVTQDNLITAGIAKRSMETLSDEAAVGVWNFNDPSVKTTCNCARHRGAKNKLTQQNKSIPPVGKKGDKPEKLDRQQSRLARGAAPFHRRHLMVEDTSQSDMPLVLSGPVASFNSTAGNALLPQLNNSTETTGGTAASVEAASPADMSPLNGHPSPPDPAMPKLSPHPPVDTGTENKPVKMATEAPPQANTAFEFIKPATASTPKVAENILSPLSWPGQQSEAKTASINNWIKSSQPQPEVTSIKRPVLPAKDTDEDELVTKSLLLPGLNRHLLSEYPVKRARVERACSLVEVGPQSPGLPSNLSQKHKTKQPDPYDFNDDEQSINPATVSKRMFRSSRDEFMNKKMDDDMKMDFGDPFSVEIPDSASSPPETPSASRNLIHTSDLKPSYDDLAHIFDSDDSDRDDNFGDHPQTVDMMDDGTTRFTMGNAMTVADGTISVSELSKMYPTPPSNNTSSDRSPGPHDILDNHIPEKPIVKTEFIPIKEDFFRDLPAVYKPLEQADFVGSDKYSPIILQSSKMSPIPRPPEYKAHWHFTSFGKPLQPSNYTNIPSIENIPSMSSRMPQNSPATFLNNSVGQQRTPMSNYNELQSPASNASSYLNKTLNSIDNQGTNLQIPEVHSLIVNVFLMDSRSNLFRDVNFDSCNICVCNMNIKGADTEIYLPDSSGESATRCVCGFSAIVNRRFGFNSGLFYEDEVDITGIRNDRYEGRKPSLLALEYQKDGEKLAEYTDLPHEILNLLISQFSYPYPSSSTIQHILRLSMMNTTSGFTDNSSALVDVLQLQDGNDITYMALDLGRQAMEHCSPNKLDDPILKATCLHKWQFLQGASRIPQNSQDCVQVLKSLQPILQDAIQNKRSIPLWEHKYKLSGPLTWKEFHQLAGRGSDENSTPQPIPSFLAGYDGDWLSLSPYSLRFWDKQFLEPYGIFCPLHLSHVRPIYVLETYNALSWLTFDPVQNDRQSCLPIHFLVLMQMYHALNAFV